MSDQFTAYSYQDSCIEWLGKVPAHWVRTALKRVVLICGRIGFRGYTTDDLVQEGEGALALGGANLTSTGSLELTKRTYLSWPKYEESPEIMVSIGDLVIGQRGTCGKVGLVDRYIGAATINPSLVLLKQSKMDSKYLCYWLMCDLVQNTFDSFLNATAVPMLSQQQIGDVPVCQPPLEEQTQIAKFLDYETAKIDALIEKQQQLIALLKEKRQAVISHAVTKGLNPDAPMRDSGVEWLGEVPTHWTVAPLKRFIVLQRGHDLPTEARREGKYPVVSSAGPIGTHNDYRCEGPGIVTGRYGTIGEFYYAPTDFWPLNTALYSVNCHGNNERFLLYMLRNMKHLFVLNSLKSAVPGVDRNDVHGEHIAAPAHPQEQRAIADYLDDKMTRLDGLTVKAGEGIGLLQERRTALISAAVTGKIDVRNWRAPDD